MEIDVVLCTYNGEKYLAEQLDSIIHQSYKCFNLYIFDDASIDGTVSIIQKYCKKYENIFFLQHPQQVGFIKNFEYGISKTCAPFIALSDQDDIWHVDKLKKQMHEALKYNDQPLMVNCDLKMVDSTGREFHPSYLEYRSSPLPNQKYLNRIITHNGVMGNTILMNRALVNNLLPFPVGLHAHDYWIAIVNELIGKRITLNEPLVNYRIHSGNVSNTVKKIRRIKKINRSKFPLLPFVKTKRIEILNELIERFNPCHEDMLCINSFMDYLAGRKSPVSIIRAIKKYNLFNDNKGYRTRLYLSILTRALWI